MAKATLLVSVFILVGVSGCDSAAVDLDRDGDGVTDALDYFPDDPNESSDADDDGIGDNADPFPETVGCPLGYEDINLDGSACPDIDECATAVDDCDVEAICTNLAGAFACVCDSGFTGTGTVCDDIDECSEETDNCDVNASCANSVGGFTCSCIIGFNGDGTTCVDTGDCSNAPCISEGDAGAVCIENVSGGYICDCTLGYSYNGNSCVDTQECLSNPCDDSGDADGVCTDAVAPSIGYSCECGTGYSSNGTACVDTNECLSNPCDDSGDADGVCTDAVAPSTGYSCVCGTGYSSDGTACVDTNECLSNPCDDSGDADGVCTDAVAPNIGYSCECGPDYSSNGVTCSGGSTPMSFFVSSTPVSLDGDGNLGGLAGADAHCQALAAATNAVKTQWVAYLSTEGDPSTTDDDVNAVDRIGTGPWYNANEEMFAADVDSLHTIEPARIDCDPGPVTCLQDRADYIALKPADELFLDENGVQITDPLQPANLPIPNGGDRGHDIFTGSHPDGTVFVGKTCNDWTSGASTEVAQTGHTDAPSNTKFSPSWNSAHDTISCSTGGVKTRGGAGFIYCFATD